jgi:hypothetical protein
MTIALACSGSRRLKVTMVMVMVRRKTMKTVAAMMVTIQTALAAAAAAAAAVPLILLHLHPMLQPLLRRALSLLHVIKLSLPGLLRRNNPQPQYSTPIYAHVLTSHCNKRFIEMRVAHCLAMAMFYLYAMAAEFMIH